VVESSQLSVDTEATSETHQSKRVRFSAGAFPTPPSTLPRKATGLTPQISRTNLSPSTPEAFVKQLQFKPLQEALSERTRRQLKRQHLSETINDIEQHKRQDAKKDKKIKELEEQLARVELELEERRQMGIELNQEEEEKDVRIAELKESVKQLKGALDQQRLASPIRDSVMGSSTETSPVPDVPMSDAFDADITDMTFINPADLNRTLDDMSPTSSFLERTSKKVTRSVTSSPPGDPSREAEVQRFEQEIRKISVALAESQSTLHAFTIQLQSLGFSEPDAPADVVLTALRSAFHQAREDVHDIVGDHEPMDNRAFLQFLTAFIREQAQMVEDYIATINTYTRENALLKGQYDGVFEKLAESDARGKRLQEQWHKMDSELDKKEKQIVGLVGMQESLDSTVDEQAGTITEQNDRIQELERERDEQLVAIDRLKQAMESYRLDLAKADKLFERTSREHEQALLTLQLSKDGTIDELQKTLGEETTLRETAQKDLANRIGEISNLESELAKAETELALLKGQLSQSQTYGDTEHSQREAAEAELQEKDAYISALEDRIDALETGMEELTTEIDQLRDRLDTERRQRENAEAELDDANNKITDLDQKLRDAAIQANELRSQLFARQVDHERIVNELNDDAAAKEDRYQADMAAEIQRREEAELTAAERELAIANLKEKIANVEDASNELLTAKEEQLRVRAIKINELETELDGANEAYDAFVKEKEAEIASLHNDIANLTDTLTKRANLIEELGEENRHLGQLRQQEVKERDGQILDLSEDLDICRKRIDALEAERSSLEKRVGDEAEHFLHYSNDMQVRLDKALSANRDKAARIKELQQDAVTMAETYNVTVEEKTRDIEHLEIVSKDRGDHIKKLKEQVDQLKQTLRNRIQADADTVKSIQQAYRDAQARGEELARASLYAGEQELVDVDAMEDVVTDLSVPGVDVPKDVPLVNGVDRVNGVDEINGANDVNGDLTYPQVFVHKTTKASKRKTRSSVRDSGINMEADAVAEI
jgi:septal ring factor EnvC (AmiA/AmiB activator)